MPEGWKHAASDLGLIPAGVLACCKSTVTPTQPGGAAPRYVTFTVRWHGIFGAIWPVCLMRGRS